MKRPNSNFVVLGLSGCMLAMSLAAAPAAGRRVISLDGTWQLAEGQADRRPALFDRKVPVPGLADLAEPAFAPDTFKNTKRLFGPEDAALAQRSYWYRREFVIEGEAPAVATLLVRKAAFGSTVYLNGTKVGESLASFTANWYDVRAALRGGGATNELVIRVGASRASLPPWAPLAWDYEKKSYIPGLFDSVELALSGTPNIVQVQVAPEISNKQARVVAQVHNAEGPTRARLKFVVREAKSGKVVGQAESEPQTLATGADKTVDVRIAITDCRLWWPTQPGPCTLEAELTGVDGKPVRSLRGTEIVDAKSNMAITAASGARQNLIGMGSTSAVPHNYSRLPLESRLDMARMVWGHDGLGFRVCKLWADQRWAPNGAQMLSSYKSLYDDINSVQTNMIWMYGATGNAQRDGLEDYAAHHAQMVADCKAGGMVFQYVGTCNEPNGSNPYLYWPSNAAALVKDFRAELDKRGLQNVKIVSPECPGVDSTGMSYIRNIKDDPAALADLTAFSSHSANMCFTPEYYNLCNVPGKESWQTEGDANGPEGTNDAGLAATFAAKACNDFNFGCQVWMHFLAYQDYDPRDNATRIMGYDPNTGGHQPFLKYYYYKQLRLGFKDGCLFRSSTSDDTREDRYSTMCFTYGDKPAIVGAAGQNVDGSWGLNVVNLTGVPERRPGSGRRSANYQPAATYDITYHVAELEKAGKLSFTLYRSSSTVRVAKQGTVSMTGGNVTFTIAPLELVTLVSAPATPAAK